MCDHTPKEDKYKTFEQVLTFNSTYLPVTDVNQLQYIKTKYTTWSVNKEISSLQKCERKFVIF